MVIIKKYFFLVGNFLAFFLFLFLFFIFCFICPMLSNGKFQLADDRSGPAALPSHQLSKSGVWVCMWGLSFL